jgi:hypothetical protein
MPERWTGQLLCDTKLHDTILEVTRLAVDIAAALVVFHAWLPRLSSYLRRAPPVANAFGRIR